MACVFEKNIIAFQMTQRKKTLVFSITSDLRGSSVVQSLITVSYLTYSHLVYLERQSSVNDDRALEAENRESGHGKYTTCS